MIFSAKFRSAAFGCIIAVAATAAMAAYNGSDAFLHYYLAPSNVLTQYQSVCQNIVVSDSMHDTLKHALAELDTAMPKLLGGNKLPRQSTPGTGSIVIAEQGSAPVANAGIVYTSVNSEGYTIQTINGATYISGTSQVGVLHGVFRFLRLMQTQKNINGLNLVDNPYFNYRVLDHWYDHYQTGATGAHLYAGGRAFKMEDFGNLTYPPSSTYAAEYARVISYCRMLCAMGLNGVCPDDVNTYQSGGLKNYTCLEASNLVHEKVFADLIGTYGIKYYLSVCYASPLLVTPIISSADAYHDSTMSGAKKWWYNKIDTVRAYIHNFGGFLLKADSEGEPGPVSTYGETESEGANPIAQALGRYGYVLIWRTFVYSSSASSDFAEYQSQQFINQTWDSSVIMRSKDGPRDFQMIEPVNQLFQIGGVRHGMEVEVDHEYTGQAIHADWLFPRWQQVLQWNNVGASQWDGAAGVQTSQILKGAGKTTGGMWGIANISDTVNWTGLCLLQADLYGYGRLTWNPNANEDSVADDWVRSSFPSGYNPGILYVTKHILERSWRAYTEYTIGHSALMPALNDNNHYVIDFTKMSNNTTYFTTYFMDFISNGIGVDRTADASGDNFLQYLTTQLADSLGNQTKCPEDYLLFYFHEPWTYTMKSGMSLIQQLEFEHYRGIHRVERFIKYWNLLKSVAPIDSGIASNVSSKLAKQLTDGSTWANTFRTEFGNYYSTQVPCRLDVMPDTSTAFTAADGASITLTALLRTQGGTTVNDTFGWSVSAGGTLSGTTTTSTNFSASADGVYTVTVWDTKWPTMTEDEQIFVGDWATSPNTGVKTDLARIPALGLRFAQGINRISITSPIAGKLSIFSLQGRFVKSVSAEKAVPVVLDTREVSNGLYLVKVQNAKVTVQGKFFIR